MQKHVNLVDLVKSFSTNIFLQNLASIQKRTSPIKFAHLAENSEKGSIANLSTKEATRDQLRAPSPPRALTRNPPRLGRSSPLMYAIGACSFTAASRISSSEFVQFTSEFTGGRQSSPTTEYHRVLHCFSDLPGSNEAT